MKAEQPAIVKQAQRILASLEEAVASRFARRHKYGVGQDLRNAARQVVRCARMAWLDRDRTLVRARELSRAVDELKLEMTLAESVKAFGSLAEFEAIGRLVSDLGRQVGGWLRALTSKGQNGRDSSAAQRAQILSSRAASHEAAP